MFRVIDVCRALGQTRGTSNIESMTNIFVQTVMCNIWQAMWKWDAEVDGHPCLARRERGKA